MRSRSLLLGLILVLAISFFGTDAAAATCTVFGTMKVEPMDQFYCDPDVSLMDCSGWREVNLDSKVGSSAAPMTNMVIELYQNGNPLWRGVTDSNGAFNATFTAPSCVGQQVVLVRRFEHGYIDGNGLLRRRFLLVGETNAVPNDTLWVSQVPLTLSSSIMPVHTLYVKSSNPSFFTRLANLYYIANSFIKEVTSWSMSSPFSCLDPLDCYRIGYETYNAGGGSTHNSEYSVLSQNAYSYGMVVRHEMAHAASYKMFHDDLDRRCESYQFNGDFNGTRDGRGCDWGFLATYEGLADFFAVRSITTSPFNAFQCTNTDPSNQRHCSEQAMLANDPDGSTDFFWKLGNGYFAGIGDQWTGSISRCINLDGRNSDAGAGFCPCAGPTLELDKCTVGDDRTLGWRNAIQISRFLWDVIDSWDEGGDDTNLSVNQFIAVLEGMPCIGNLGAQDGTCDESAPSTPTGLCVPTFGYGGGQWGTGTRDSLNVYDLGQLIPGDQTDERILNCVQQAQD